MSTYTRSALQGNNPLIPFKATYAFQEGLREAGMFYLDYAGNNPYDVFHGKDLQYRVDHGHGFVTQNTWHDGDLMPSMEEIER